MSLKIIVLVTSRKQVTKESGCKKCASKEPFVLISKIHAYCGPCFDEYCTGKFRATVGKARSVQNGFRVLIACSGGVSSLALVQMVKQGLELENHHRRLRFVPVITHICDSSTFLPNEDRFNESNDVSQQILDHLKTYQFETYAGRIELIFSSPEESGAKFITSDLSLPKVDATCLGEIKSMLCSLSDESNKEELIRRMRHRALMMIAAVAKCDVIFLASSATKLATQLIVDVAQGKGNQIHLETGFADDRLDRPLLKPLRDLTKKELTYYNLYHKIKPFTITNLHTLQNTKVTIGKATESFITSLERDFPATVFSVCRISTKVKSKRTEGEKCILCGTISDNFIDEESSAMAAREGQWRSLIREKGKRDKRNTYCYTCSLIVEDSKESRADEIMQTISQSNVEALVSQFLIPPS